MTSTQFDSNTNLGGDGGAVDAVTTLDATVSVSNCSFIGNVAKRNDRLTGLGGGMSINAGKVYIAGSRFDGNIAGDACKICNDV